MRNRFDEQLLNLNHSMINMGNLCEKAIACAVNSLMKSDKSLANDAIEAEKEIDRAERDIEALCMKLLVSQQPVARDLRQISSALKMVTDMERIGDQAADIAEIVTYIDLKESLKNEHIASMAKAVIKMVTHSVEAFVEKDKAAAIRVIHEDDEVDELFSEIKDDLIKLIKEENISGEEILDILMIAKYLERIGDHATNIAEWVVYSITGSHKI